MQIIPVGHIDDTRRSLAFLDDPKLLDRRPSSPSLRTRQNRNLAHVCSFACKLISKLSLARWPSGRRPSPEGYLMLGQSGPGTVQSTRYGTGYQYCTKTSSRPSIIWKPTTSLWKLWACPRRQQKRLGL